MQVFSGKMGGGFTTARECMVYKYFAVAADHIFNILQHTKVSASGAIFVDPSGINTLMKIRVRGNFWGLICDK